MAAPITKLRIGLKPDTPEEHTRLLIDVNTEEAQTSLQITTDLRVRANPATAKIYYYNFDGSELLYTETIEPGGNGSWDGEPGRAGGEGYAWIFKGWAAEPNASEPTEGVLDGIFSARRVYAAYLRRDTTGFVAFDGISTLKTANGLKNWDGKLFWSIDAATWTEWHGEEIAAGVDSKIYLRGTGNRLITGNPVNQKNFVITGGDSGVKCDGNIEFLLDFEATLAGEPPSMRPGCFCALFYNCAQLISPPRLPARTITTFCYYSMFEGCSALKSAPELPATIMYDSCYSYMFRGCSALESAPELPATSLASHCYSGMFLGTGLKSAPKLPATIMMDSCYSGMFSTCTALKSAPELPATILAESCYDGMFRSCRALESVPDLPATTLPYRAYRSMFNGCTGIKIAAAASETFSKPFRIPAAGEGTADATALGDMFVNTGGTFKGTPAINTTYYLAPPAST